MTTTSKTSGTTGIRIDALFLPAEIKNEKAFDRAQKKRVGSLFNDSGIVFSVINLRSFLCFAAGFLTYRQKKKLSNYFVALFRQCSQSSFIIIGFYEDIIRVIR